MAVAATTVGPRTQAAWSWTVCPDHAPPVSARVRWAVNVIGLVVVVVVSGWLDRVSVDPTNVAVRIGLNAPVLSRSHRAKLYVVPGVNPPMVTPLSTPEYRAMPLVGVAGGVVPTAARTTIWSRSPICGENVKSTDPTPPAIV